MSAFNFGSAMGTAVQGFQEAIDTVADQFREFQQSHHHQHQHQHHRGQQPSQPPPETRPAPPASARAIRQLPTIRVAPEDLVEPCNRECCICLEENHLNDYVTRLPCAHIFHSRCLVDWLTNHHCTCPVCRYELPTDDPSYELIRLERMKHRKPRYAMYELRRMSIPQLLALNKKPAPGILEKSELIQILIENERVHLIPAPEPVNYMLSELRTMGVSQLKRTMEDAGVFYHPEDVVEKGDMLTIFYNSGRLNILPEPTDRNTPAQGKADKVIRSAVSMDESIRNTLEMQHTLVETVDSDDEDVDGDRDRGPFCFHPPYQQPTHMFGVEKEASDSLPRTQRAEIPTTHTNTYNISEAIDGNRFPKRTKTSNSPNQNCLYEVEDVDGWSDDDGTVGPSGNDGVPMETVDAHIGLNQISMSEVDDVEESSIAYAYSAPPVETIEVVFDNPSNASTSRPQSAAQFIGCSIAQLRDIARKALVDLTGCVERSEMVERLVAANAPSPTAPLTTADFDKWSVSHLRALAFEVSVDLSSCVEREQMVQEILTEANERRPFIKNYLRALSPLATMSLSELKGVSREWQVNISDCIEKGEIIHRLVTRGQRFASF